VIATATEKKRDSKKKGHAGKKEIMVPLFGAWKVICT
jgi:hypothetical protein